MNAPELSEHEVMERTIDACAWLLPIAEQCCREHGWDDAIVRWLDQLGGRLSAELPPRH
jgi:hypothetical protein